MQMLRSDRFLRNVLFLDAATCTGCGLLMVLVGGGVLIVVAVHEIIVWWELVPSWAPLAIGGGLLVGLAITYERRRRDLTRLRSAIARMT